jgi:DNA-binding NarL/FixJ family response regulator
VELWETVVGARRTPVVIGRGAERAELEAALAGVDAGRGAGSVVLVIGDAGIGKTRLVEDFTARAEGLLSVTGGCVEATTDALAYAPWTELLWWLRRSGADIVGDAERTQLARLLPDLGEPPSEAEGDGQILLFEAVVGALHRVASARHLAVVVEDVHWIDAASRDLLLYVARNIRRIPMLLIITSRPGGASPERRELFSQLQRLGATTIEVGALADDDAAGVASLLTGADLDSPDVLTVVKRAQGNPLFVEELVAALDADSLPTTIRLLMLSRFEALGADARTLVETAAIVGTRVPRALLFAAMTTSATAAASEAVEAGVLTSDGRGYAFAHDLLREAVLAELAPHERVVLHAAIAAALNDVTIVDSELDLIAERARHWDAAERPTEALQWTVAAGRQADDRYAFAAALVWYERALTWWDGVAHPEEVSGLTRVNLLFAAADAAGASGRFERAADLAEQAARGAENPLARVEAFARSNAHLWAAGRTALLADIANAALAELDEVDERGRAAFLVDYAGYLLHDARATEALELGPTLIDSVSELGDPMLEARAHLYLGSCYEQVCEEALGLSELERAADVARRAGLLSMLSVVLYNHASLLSSVPRYADCLAVLDEVDALIAANGIRRQLVISAAMRAQSLIWVGNLDDAQTVLDQWLDIPMEGAEWHAYASARALLALHEGNYDRAVAVYQPSRYDDLSDTERLTAQAIVRAEARTWLGDASGALTIIAEALELTRDHTEPYWLGFLAMVGVRAAADIVTANRADTVERGVAQERADQLARAWEALEAKLPRTFPLNDAQALAVQAEFARMTGENVVEKSAAAAFAFEQIAMPYYVVYFDWRQAEAALADGDRSLASSKLNSALAGALVRRYDGLAQLIEQTARAAQIRLGRKAASTDELLSGREVEVLKLLADGMSNPDIADTLIIGRRTVRAHVSNILQKLGAASRAEAVAVAHRRNIL